MQKAFSTNNLTYRAPHAVDGELNPDFKPVLARNMVRNLAFKTLFSRKVNINMYNKYLLELCNI